MGKKFDKIKVFIPVNIGEQTCIATNGKDFIPLKEQELYCFDDKQLSDFIVYIEKQIIDGKIKSLKV